jgi:hypothetical protein
MVSGSLIQFPTHPLERWRIRHRVEAARDPDPRELRACSGHDCQTFAWRGYDGLCGWCYEEEQDTRR